MNALILMMLLQQAGFREPPLEVSGFRYWEDPGRWSNAADQPSRTVPPDIDFHEYLTGRGVCTGEAEDTCRVSIHFRLTLNNKNPETATRAVVQYLITGPSGVTYEGFAWMRLDEPGRRAFVVENREWVEQRPEAVPQGESRMLQGMLRLGKRMLVTEKP